METSLYAVVCEGYSVIVCDGIFPIVLACWTGASTSLSPVASLPPQRGKLGLGFSDWGTLSILDLGLACHFHPSTRQQLAVMMRIRWPVAGAFAVYTQSPHIAWDLFADSSTDCCLSQRSCKFYGISKSANDDSGFTPHPASIVHDKLQHFLMFFLLTLLFYWIFDTTKRRILNMTITFSIIVDIVSEVAQAIVTVSPFAQYPLTS